MEEVHDAGLAKTIGVSNFRCAWSPAACKMHLAASLCMSAPALQCYNIWALKSDK